MMRVVQWEFRDVPADVGDPADRRPQEDDQPDRDEVPGERERHDRERQARRVDERQDARRRHVDLLADRRGATVEFGVVEAHPCTYTRAATKVRANMISPTMAA